MFPFHAPTRTASMRRPSIRAAFGTLCFTFAALTGSLRAQDAPAASADTLLQRVVVIGASASDGFGLEAELETPAGLEVFLDAAWTAPRAKVVSHATNQFFFDPRGVGRDQIDAAREAKPTLVFAVDFAFWFGYGVQASDDARLALLDKGLAMLDELEAPILLGDFPDMRPALKGEGPFGQPMLMPSQIPSVEAIARLNARLDEWSAERPRVLRVPLADFVARLQTGRDLELRGQRWSKDESGRLLQRDLLHPSVEGTAAMALLALDALERGREEVAPDDVKWKVDEVVEGVMETTRPAREARRAKRAAREERMRKRKQEREGDGDGDGDEPAGGEDRSAAPEERRAA